MSTGATSCSNQAFHEIMPTRPNKAGKGRIYRKIPYGPNVDVFVLDMRSYRGENSANLQATPSAAIAFLGAEQIAWLKRELKRSDATWKISAADMPIGLWVQDYAPATNPHEPGVQWWEAVANGDNGVAKGRELEIADILSFLKRNEIRNTVWLTADVHYCAAHYYDPAKAASTDFGQIDVDGHSKAMTVKLVDVAGTVLFSQELAPAGDHD